MNEKKGKSTDLIVRGISKKQSVDTGMAMTLICLLISLYSRNFIFTFLAVILLVINMVFPAAFRPFARIWFGLSNILGTIVSKFILAILFFVVVTPIGIIRRLLKADSMKLKQWKKDRSSVFTELNHLIQADDIEKPY